MKLAHVYYFMEEKFTQDNCFLFLLVLACQLVSLNGICSALFWRRGDLFSDTPTKINMQGTNIQVNNINSSYSIQQHNGQIKMKT